MNLGRPNLAELEGNVLQQSELLVEALDGELRALRRQRDELDDRIRMLARKRLLYCGRANGDINNEHVTSSPSKPVAVKQVLEEVTPRSLRLAEIHDELVRRGWSTDGKRDRHALEVAVRSLEKRGVLSRPRRGYYNLRIDAGRAAHERAA